MSKFSYSRVSCYKSCPYQYKLRYIDKLETIPNTDANNALYLGTAMHTGIEKTVKDALVQYFSNYPVIDDLQVNEAMKLEHLIPLAKAAIPHGRYETKVEDDEFIGFMDLLVPKKRKNHFDIYDFKYVSGDIGYELVYRMDSVDNTNDYYEYVPTRKLQQYHESAQLHVYKHFYEKTCPGHKIDKLYYVFIPKTMIRQKKTEDLYQFRKRLQSELDKMEIMVEEVEYDFQKVREYLDAVAEIKAATQFPKNCTKLCAWCEYEQYCKKGDTTMILPKNERRALGANTKKVIWLYGAPFSGKTYLTDKFPDPLMLNTDGNIRNVTAAYLPIKDVVTTTGNVTKRKFAWTVFKETIEELEKKQNDFKTIVVDLLEDVYEHCRTAMYDEMGIVHESDAGFGKGYDIIRKEFLDTVKRMCNLDYENIILISHEDSSKAITTKGGSSLTTIRPNIQEKLASKVAGMVDIVGRVIANGDVRKLSFKTDEYVFGGGRLANIKGKEIQLTYDALMQVYAAPAEEKPVEAPARRRVVEAPATENK